MLRPRGAVVDALLAFSRASHQMVTDESGAVRFAVKEVTDELSPLVLKVGASIEVQELPDAQVRCSQELLHIALANVVGNAVKYLERRTERRCESRPTPKEGGAASMSPTPAPASGRAIRRRSSSRSIG
jgi:signal transduction histidine kinase